MKVLKETTKWDNPKQLNHTYILNDKGRLIGYIPLSDLNLLSCRVKWFSKPTSFSKSRRKFIEQPELAKELQR